MNQMIGVAVIDDEQDARSLVNIHISRHHNLTLLGEASDGPEAQRLLEEVKPDLVFLDIQMPGFNGIEVLKRCHTIPQVIFITAFNDFAIKAFELNAVDYLLKPFTPERFDQAVLRAINRLSTPLTQDVIDNLLDRLLHQKETAYLHRLAYKHGSVTEYIDVDSIQFIKAADQYVEVHLEGQRYVIRQSMDYLEKQLSPLKFFRTHRSAIVRLSLVKAISQDEFRHFQVILRSGEVLPLSQVRKSLLAAKLQGGE